jgi:hypothetical protein
MVIKRSILIRQAEKSGVIDTETYISRLLKLHPDIEIENDLKYS